MLQKAGFALRHINMFFTPSFILLPLSPAIGGVEIAKIIGVCLIGFVVMLATTAYITRGLQLLFGRSKRGIVERAEEMGDEDDDIPLTHSARDRGAAEDPSAIAVAQTNELDASITMPIRAQDPHQIRNTYGPPDTTTVANSASLQPSLRQDPQPLTRPERYAAFSLAHLDTLTYTICLIFIGLPLYYSTTFTLSAHLPITILAYFAADSLPPTYKKYIHPVLLSSGLTILTLYLLALTHHSTLTSTLHAYTTGTRYPQLLQGITHPYPGAGDILSSTLDVSIVALALPLFHYRQDLLTHYPTILLPNILLATLSLFLYPLLTHTLGISPTRALSFASRSLTLALANPATANLGGDLHLVAVLCIMSGVLGVLVGESILLRWLKVPEDDYVTRGVALGLNASAIVTASLLRTDPRAAALSSVSMTVFGTCMVVLTSVPGVVGAVRALVAL